MQPLHQKAPQVGEVRTALQSFSAGVGCMWIWVELLSLNIRGIASQKTALKIMVSQWVVGPDAFLTENSEAPTKLFLYL
jgi:hypothetical protein